MGLCASSKTNHTGMSLYNLKNKREHGEFVVYLGCGTNIPNMDVGSLSDCFAVIEILDETGTPCAGEFKTQIRRDSLHPTWNSFAAFPMKPLATDTVKLTLYDHDDFSAADLIGHVEIPVTDLRKHSVAEPADFVLNMDTKVKPPQPKQPVTVTMGCLQNNESCVPTRKQDESFTVEKEFWLIRHGESKWNEATEHKNVGGLLGYDHPLNVQGIDQAINFNSIWTKAIADESIQMSSAESKFVNAERVVASPLTRATQTALITCHNHPNLNNGNPLTLYRNLREKKNKALSLDTVGQEIGDGIKKRVLEQLIEEKFKTDEKKANDYMVNIDYNDCDSEWWTGHTHGDSTASLTARYSELWGFLKYSKQKSMILVGHSLFFRELCQRFLNEDYCEQNKEFTSELKKHKLDNAACLYIRVVFPKPHSQNKTEPSIVEAELVFGSKLKSHSHSHKKQSSANLVFCEFGKDEDDAEEEKEEK